MRGQWGAQGGLGLGFERLARVYVWCVGVWAVWVREGGRVQHEGHGRVCVCMGGMVVVVKGGSVMLVRQRGIQMLLLLLLLLLLVLLLLVLVLLLLLLLFLLFLLLLLLLLLLVDLHLRKQAGLVAGQVQASCPHQNLVQLSVHSVAPTRKKPPHPQQALRGWRRRRRRRSRCPPPSCTITHASICTGE